MSEHLIEIWEAEGEQGTLCTAFCLTCNWMGGDGTRVEAEEEAQLHREGKHRPWQREPWTTEAWKPGDPTIR